MLFRNVFGQGIYLYSYIIATSLPKTGDAANITGTLDKDGAATPTAFFTVHPIEINNGVYWQPLLQAETDAQQLAFTWVGSAGSNIIPILISTDVKLADAVAHGGTPGSSSATFAMRKAVIQNTSGDAFEIHGSTYGLTIQGGTASALSIFSSSSSLPTIEIDGPQANPAIVIYGPYVTSGPALVIDTTTASGLVGGNAIQLLSDGDTIAITPTGTNVHGINIAGGTVSGDAIHTNVTSGYGLNGTLGPNALDQIDITSPTGSDQNFRERILYIWRRFFQKSAKDKNALTITMYADNGTSVLTTQDYNDDGTGNETLESIH